MNIKELKTKVKVKLPPILDAHKAEDLYKAMTDSLSTQKSVEIDAGDIEKLDTLCAQILVASQIDCHAQHIPFHIKTPSKRMANTLSMLGLETKLLQQVEI